MNLFFKIRRQKTRKYLIKRYKEAKRLRMKYPMVRWVISDAKCQMAIDKKGLTGMKDLVKWQESRNRYWDKIMELRPRNNEFFSY